MLSLATGYQELSVVYPKNQAFRQDTSFMMHFSVFNSTGFMLKEGQADCSLFIYNGSNHEILHKNLTWEGNGMELYADLNRTYSAEIGEYPYQVQCNSSTEGGYVSTAYLITSDGRLYEENSTLLPMMIFIFGTIAVMYWFSTMIDDKDVWNQGIKLFLNMIGLALLIVASGYMLINLSVMNVSQNSYSFASTMHFVLLIVIFALIAFFMVIFINKLIDFIRNLKKPMF